MDGDLTGRRALVVGGGRGIGRACALRLARAGAHVTIVSRNAAELAEVVTCIQAEGGRASALVCDVTDDAAVAALGELDIDVLVNSAGVNVLEPFVDVAPESYDRIMGLNARAAFFVSLAVARRMVDAGIRGSIIHVSSQLGHVGLDQRSVYAMSKHAIEGLTKVMAIELASAGIRVNTVAPTFVRTALIEQWIDRPDFQEKISRIPLGRMASEDDVAAAVEFLASSVSSMVTGTSLRVDGGFTAL